MNKVSAVVSAYNEEKNLKDCLKSLNFADEIIVVDNKSTDNTSKIAFEFTKNVFKQENNPDEIDLQKNFGFEKATSEWILCIDADERVSEELANEIKKILNVNPSSISDINGFWIPRKNYIYGKWIEHTGWYPDYQLRLFRKGKGKYTKKHMHEDITLEGMSAKFTGHIIHQNYDSVSSFLTKTLVYSKNEAQNLIDKGYEFSYFDAIKFPLSEFLSRFFARKGYRDGLHGLVLSMLMAFYHFIIFCFIWEKKDFIEYNKADFLDETEKEFKKAGKELIYWFAKEKIEGIKSPLKKAVVRLKNKIRS